MPKFVMFIQILGHKIFSKIWQCLFLPIMAMYIHAKIKTIHQGVSEKNASQTDGQMD